MVFRRIFWRLVKTLVAEGLVKPGLCFHGLRHSLGTALYDLGLDRDARKAALGHTSDAASMVYERGGNGALLLIAPLPRLTFTSHTRCGQCEEREVNRWQRICLTV